MLFKPSHDYQIFWIVLVRYIIAWKTKSYFILYYDDHKEKCQNDRIKFLMIQFKLVTYSGLLTISFVCCIRQWWMPGAIWKFFAILFTPYNHMRKSWATTNPHFFCLKSELGESKRNSMCMFYVRVDWHVQRVRPKHVDFISFDSIAKFGNLVFANDKIH